jgi:tryptophan synthase
MGTTGSSAKIAVNAALPEIISRVKEYATVPIAVGFGVATRDHFDTVSDAGADGVVIGSRLVSVLKEAPRDQIPQRVRAFCLEISLKGQPPRVRSPSSKSTTPSDYPYQKDSLAAEVHSSLTILPMRFGQFGGQYVPEALFDCLVELEEAHKAAIADPAFWKEFESFYGYMNRPSKLYFAESLTKHAGGAKIWLKREDLYVLLSGSILVV